MGNAASAHSFYHSLLNSFHFQRQPNGRNARKRRLIRSEWDEDHAVCAGRIELERDVSRQRRFVVDERSPSCTEWMPQ